MIQLARVPTGKYRVSPNAAGG